jgi:hypothetical protein
VDDFFFTKEEIKAGYYMSLSKDICYNNYGIIHCENGPAIEYADGYKRWYQNGLLHREDGPAIEFADGYKRWYQNGKLHRLDGPAIEYPNGNKYWYINNIKINCTTQEEFEKLLKLKAFW